MWLGKPYIRVLLTLLFITMLWIYVKYFNQIMGIKSDTMQVIQNEESSINSIDEHVDVEKIVIGVYYEALCPDSRGFIMRDLKSTYDKIPNNVIIELIPYGKATTNIGPDGYEFKCQHGARECEANMIHACAIDIITNPSVQLNFITCMIDRNVWPIKITRTCAEEMNIDAEPILNCAKSIKGSELLAKYGKMTDALRPPVTYVPTITLDKDTANQAAILINLLREVCKRFKTPPAGCL
ncbi:hypothetical protein PV325_009104 [Microctonus aethiopoides]|uniref:Uncharacterized protein n=1 Tax=Microctonus aethiopoides TaxID=144406 RepID=A0AA39KSJ5_9HYME|nr:hypothetical protein PV325_009104 [Microctonus aethiopoides]KAK0092937.1 hypothetical protein PV326_000271 [Microctonus aethiopoides]KAK0172031.1 hypothetical protein PV328_005404 [Microctonus aethiopoides]